MIHVFLTCAPEFTELTLVQRIFSQKDGNIFLLEGPYLIKRVTTWSWLCYNYPKLLLLFRKTMNSHTLKTTNTIKFTRILLKRKSNLTSLQINFLFSIYSKGQFYLLCSYENVVLLGLKLYHERTQLWGFSCKFYENLCCIYRNQSFRLRCKSHDRFLHEM